MILYERGEGLDVFFFLLPSCSPFCCHAHDALYVWYKIFCHYSLTKISMARMTVPIAVVIIIKGNPTLNHLLKVIG